MITKQQLILGDIVITRNGYFYIICKYCSQIKLLGPDGWMPFDNYDNKLNYHSIYSPNYQKAWSIVQVLRVKQQFRKISNQLEFAIDCTRSEIHNMIKNSVDITDGLIDRNFIDFSLFIDYYDKKK